MLYSPGTWPVTLHPSVSALSPRAPMTSDDVWPGSVSGSSSDHFEMPCLVWGRRCQCSLSRPLAPARWQSRVNITFYLPNNYWSHCNLVALFITLFWGVSVLLNFPESLTLHPCVLRPGRGRVVAAGSWQWPPEVGTGNTGQSYRSQQWTSDMWSGISAGPTVIRQGYKLTH